MQALNLNKSTIGIIPQTQEPTACKSAGRIGHNWMIWVRMAVTFNSIFFLSAVALHTIASNLGLGTIVDSWSRGTILQTGLAIGVMGYLVALHFIVKRDLLELTAVATILGAVIGATFSIL